MTDPFELAFECQENWERMPEVAPGQRRCERCSETVVDLSRLTRKQALAVVGGPNPPCVSFLKRDGAPVFARPTWGSGLVAAAAGLLAACATPAEEPSCELAPEPVVEEPLLGDGLPTAPLVTEPIGAPMPITVVPQNVTDTARAGDANDVDGASGGVTATGHRTPGISRVRGRMPHYTRTAGVPPRRDPNAR
jgi:hypothetical protein